MSVEWKEYGSYSLIHGGGADLSGPDLIIRNIPWDLNRKSVLRTSVTVYRTYHIGKYNRAGHLKPSLTNDYFVWDPDYDGTPVRVNAKNGNLTSTVYDEEKDFYKAFPEKKKAPAKRGI